MKGILSYSVLNRGFLDRKQFHLPCFRLAIGAAVKGLGDRPAACALYAAERGTVLPPESLVPNLCHALPSRGQAGPRVASVGEPAVQTMFDTHNTVSEAEPHDELIRRYAPYIRHVHVNEMDGRHPGTGNYDFGLLLRTLREIRYAGWISLEVFQFKPTGEQVARESAQFLRRLEVAPATQ